jgi:hypothetical protein
MASWLSALKNLIRGPDLTGNAKRTFRYHLAYALLDAAAGGILLNAPIVAIKALAAENWHLPLRELFSGAGMIATLYLGCWMAPRRKMPFVFVPGVLAALFALTARTTHSAFWFLTLLGLSAMFEIVTRPAVAAILRVNYPVEQRGHATGEVRKWSSLAFVASSLISALVLQLAAGYHETTGTAAPSEFAEGVLAWSAEHIVQILVVIAGLVSLSSFICFRQIRVDEDPEQQRHDLKPEIGKSFRDAAVVVARDGRYRRYLLGCFLAGFFQMLYLPLLWVFLSENLQFGYVGCSALMHAIPALVAFAATGAIGRLLDRTNPWVSWAWIRFVWGFGALLLAATPYCAAMFPVAVIILPLVSRVLRGSVQGGWWIMWWQIGVTHFAPPGEDTSRYMGVMVFLNGAIRLVASTASMVLVARNVPPVALIVVGGVGVILSGVYSLWQGVREKRERRPDTMTDFEHQFLEQGYR